MLKIQKRDKTCVHEKDQEDIWGKWVIQAGGSEERETLTGEALEATPAGVGAEPLPLPTMRAFNA